MKHKFALVAAIVSAFALAGCKEIGTGEKIGTVTNVSPNTGLWCPTMEVEIIRGGMSGGTGVVGAAFHGTVETNPEIFAFLLKAMEERREVKVKWRREFMTFCRSENKDDYFITSAEYADSPHLPTLPISTVTPVTVIAVMPQAAKAETHDSRVQRLLMIQGQLLQELATK